MLPDGSRLHVVIPDITRQHWAVNIRRFVLPAASLDELVALGTLTPHAAAFLEAAVVSGLNVIVAGGTQAGKTTLLTKPEPAPVRKEVAHPELIASWSRQNPLAQPNTAAVYTIKQDVTRPSRGGSRSGTAGR